MPADVKPRVLDVGQCNPDHANITRMIKARFDAVVDRAASIDQVMHMVGFYDYDLILVNRLFDADGTEGMELLRQIKADETMRQVPVMLVSNLADAQEAAVDAGAVPGFGKASLDTPETIELLTPFLAG